MWERQQEPQGHLHQTGSTTFEYYRPAASVRMEESTNISEDWADHILVTLGMKEPDYVAARVPRPGGGAVGELTPIGDCILPLLACLLVYIGVRVKRARANAQVKL